MKPENTDSSAAQSTLDHADPRITAESYTRQIQSPESAAAKLADSERGRKAASDLLEFLQNGGLGLDGQNQRAIHDLLDAAWKGGKAGSVRCALHDILYPSD